MVTENFKNLLGMVFTSSASACGSLRATDVTGRTWYVSPQFSFPSTRTQAVTTSATGAGISVGTGSNPTQESDYNLDEPLTSGINLTLTGTTTGVTSDGHPYITYKVTITNTGSETIRVREIGYKQTLKVCPKPKSASVSDVVFLLDRTLLQTPIELPAGDAGVISYTISTSPHPEKTVSGVKIVSFTWGSVQDVCAMIDAARQGTISLEEDGGWQVGDMRIIPVESFTGGNNVSVAAQNFTIAISSFLEYNGCGNLFQFDFVDCAGNFRMNSSSTTAGGYDSTEMFATTIPALINALPDWLKSRMLTFDVLASAGGSSLGTIERISGNKLALRAAVEVFGPGVIGGDGEGSLVKYYESNSKIKTNGFNGSAVGWWCRSATGAALFCVVNGGGGANNFTASSAYGLAPFGCI